MAGATLAMCAARCCSGARNAWIPASCANRIGLGRHGRVALILHFGLFQLLSCFWRARGIDARPIMNEPMHSASVTEFWSNRWNTAFRDLDAPIPVRSTRAAVGAHGGANPRLCVQWAVHDLVISLPAERRLRRAHAILHHPGTGDHAGTIIMSANRLDSAVVWRGRLFTALVLLTPIQLSSTTSSYLPSCSRS